MTEPGEPNISQPTSSPPDPGDDIPERRGETPSLLPAEQVAHSPSRAKRAVAAAGAARDRTIRQLVAILVPLIKATGIPLLIVVLLAGVPAAALIVVALLRSGPDDVFWLIVAGIGLIVAGWLGLRRHQLLAVAQDPAALAAALSSVVTGRDMWEQVVNNVSAGRVGAKVVRRSRPLRVLGGLWRGVQLTGVVTQITEREELLPLLPGRLRGIWLLVIACLVSAVVMGISVLFAGIIYLFGG